MLLNLFKRFNANLIYNFIIGILFFSLFFLNSRLISFLYSQLGYTESVQTWLYRKNSYTEFFARAQFIKDFLSRIRYNFSKPGSVSDAKMLRIPLIFGITFFFWTIKGTACQISSFMYHFRPYSLFKVSSSSTL